MSNEAFETWAAQFDTESNEYIDMGANEFFCAGYESRQPEIDALKAELRTLRDGIQTMGDALADGVWAHLISSDDDLNALDAGISSVVGKLTALQTEVERLRKDAERWNYSIKYGFPINFQVGWRSPLPNGNLTGGYPGFVSAIDAIDTAMKETK